MKSSCGSRILQCVTLVLILAGLNGCMTACVTERAHGYTYKDADGKQHKAALNPGYYAFVPVTVPLDIGLLPVYYLGAFLNLAISGHFGVP